MNENYDKKRLEKELERADTVKRELEKELSSADTVVMNTQELEEKLRRAREEALAEAAARSGFAAMTDDLDLSQFKDDFVDDLPDAAAQDAVSAAGEDEPEYEPEPERRGRTSGQAARILEEKEAEARHKRRKKIIIISLAVLLALAAALTTVIIIKNSSGKGYDEAFAKGQEYYYAGNYDDALTELYKALDIKQTDDCLLLMSQCYEAKEDYASAIAILEKSTTGDARIQARIAQLREAKAAYEDGKTVKIGDINYALDTLVLDLSDKNLSSDDLKDIGRLTELTSLKLGRNSITSISFLSGLNKLVSLDLSYNDISDISPLSQLTQLRTLHLDNNSITDYTPLYSLKSLSTLTISGMQISDKSAAALKAALPDCIIFSDDPTVEVVSITLGGKTFKSDVTSLDLSGRGISDISVLSVCTKLTSLDLSGNKISDLTPLVDIPDLESLDISDNNIRDISPLMSMTELSYLDASGNDIKSFSVLGDLINLKTLYLKDTGLEDADLGKLYGLSKLRTLSIEDNSALTQSAIDALKSRLSSCTISYTESVGTVTLGGKAFAADSERVVASNLGITDISAVTKFTNLKRLDLSRNGISNISALSSMTGLESLDLSYNNISDITPLLGLKNLSELYVGGNGLTEEQIQQLRSSLNCQIIGTD